MDRVVSTTVSALTKLGEKLERRFSTGEDETYTVEDSDHSYDYPYRRSAFQRPFDGNYEKPNASSLKKRNSFQGGSRKYSADNLSASPSPYNNFNNYRQTPANRKDGFGRGPYGNGMGAPLNYGYQGAYNNMSAVSPYGAVNGSVGYAPDYYIAERRQLELVPAPPPRIIQQNIPVPVPVDRPVPQPYAVEVPRPVPVDRPVPVPVPTAVPVDRPVPVYVDRAVPQPYPVEVPKYIPVDRPVPVAVPTPVPVPVPTATPPVQVPCYVPVAVPVPSPPPSPVMIENSVTHTQRWVTNSPAAMNQQSVASVPSFSSHSQQYVNGTPVMMNPQQYPYGSAAYMNQARVAAGSPVMGMNAFPSFANNSFSR